MSLIEIWFGTFNRRLIEWGGFKSVEVLEESIRRFVTQQNEIWAHPYKWTFDEDPGGGRREGRLGTVILRRRY